MAQRRAGSGEVPGFGAALFHFIEDVVGELAMAALDASRPMSLASLMEARSP